MYLQNLVIDYFYTRRIGTMFGSRKEILQTKLPTFLLFSWRQVYSAPIWMPSSEKVRHSVLCRWAGQAQGMSWHLTFSRERWTYVEIMDGYPMVPPTSFPIFFWLVVWNILYFSIIYGIILPIDFHIFQRGRSTTNQFSNFFHFCWLASLGVSMVVTFLDPFGSRFPTAGLPLDPFFILDQLVIQEATKWSKLKKCRKANNKSINHHLFLPENGDRSPAKFEVYSGVYCILIFSNYHIVVYKLPIPW